MVNKKPDNNANRRSQLLKGLAELAVLSAMRDQPQYGLSLLDRLRNEAGLEVADASIYPLLYRLEHAGYIKATWRLDEAGRRPRRYYELTDLGRRDLKSATDDWRAISREFTAFLFRSSDRERR